MNGVRRHYERVAGDYSRRRWRGLAGSLRRAEWRGVLALLQANPAERVLDVGCGDGALAAELAARGCRLVAVDFAMPMAAAARRRGVASVVADVQALGVRPVFRWVAWVGSSEFVPDLKTAARSVAACLEDGGHLIMLFPRRNWFGVALLLFHCLHGVAMKLRSREDVVHALMAAGFEAPERWRRCAAAWVCRVRLGELR